MKLLALAASSGAVTIGAGRARSNVDGPQEPSDADASVQVSLAAFFEQRVRELPPAARVCEAAWQDALYAPLAEYLGRSGKLVRARLVRHGWRLGGGRGEPPQTLCLLPEILHSASLIVDDLQDGAVMRRGGLALHRVIGPERALNAANWLYFWPYALLDELRLSAARRRACVELITATLLDCHRGQALDLGVQVWTLAQDSVPELVAEQSRLKTGRLTALCVALGAVAAGAGASRVEVLQRFGEQVGVGLQMLDDLTAVLVADRHDKAGEDLRCGRPTWVWALAAQRCSQWQYHALAREARAAVERGDWQAVCAELATLIGADALAPARAVLKEAGDLLAAHGFAAAAVSDVRGDLDRLERAYG
jgi:geranylgeranyl pyrophosphate synthase